MGEADVVSVKPDVRVRVATVVDAAAWGSMRRALWPDADDADREEQLRLASGPEDRAIALLAVDADSGEAVGFAEASIRREYVNGTETSPVGFLEGWYVRPEWRASGVGRMLVMAVAAWVRDRGCRELASDTWLDNPASQAAHLGCGFEETERVVNYRMQLGMPLE